MTTMTVWLALALSGVAAVNREPITMGERLSIFSRILGEERTISVWLPERYGCVETRYPVLFLMDGQAHFLHASGTVEFLARNRMIPEMIVVALSSTDRIRDFTPPVTGSPDATCREALFPNQGGAGPFLAFLEQELIPFVDETYRTEPLRVLCGHSFGGLFALFAFVSNSAVFKGYIAASPCLWWDDQRLTRRADAFLEKAQNLRRCVFLTMGREEDPASRQFEAFRQTFQDHDPEGLVWSTLHLTDEHHGSVVLRSVYFGLKVVFEGWSVPESLLTGDLNGVRGHFQKLSTKYGYQVQPPELLLNQMGYAALAREDIATALEIFEFNVKTHSSSANVYDSYAEALEIDQQVKKARKNYERAYQQGLEMNDPNVSCYKRNLDRIVEKMEVHRDSLSRDSL